MFYLDGELKVQYFDLPSSPLLSYPAVCRFEILYVHLVNGRAGCSSVSSGQLGEGLPLPSNF